MDKPQSLQAEIVNDDALDAREAFSERLASVLWIFSLRGLLAAGVGLVALFWPTGSISLLLKFDGVLLIVDVGLTLFGLGRERFPAQS